MPSRKGSSFFCILKSLLSLCTSKCNLPVCFSLGHPWLWHYLRVPTMYFVCRNIVLLKLIIWRFRSTMWCGQRPELTLLKAVTPDHKFTVLSHIIHYGINYTKPCYTVFVYWQIAKLSPTLISVCRIQSFPSQEVRFLKYRHNTRTNTVKSYGMHSFCVKELYTCKSSRSSDFMQNFQDNVFQRLDNHSSRVHRQTPVEMYHSPRRLPAYRLTISGCQGVRNVTSLS